MRPENGARIIDIQPPNKGDHTGVKERPRLSVIQGEKKSETELLLQEIIADLTKETKDPEQSIKLSNEDYKKIRLLFRDISNNPLAEQIYRHKLIGSVFGNKRDIDVLLEESHAIARHQNIDPSLVDAAREREIEEFTHELKTKPLSPDDLSTIRGYSLSGSSLATEILRAHDKRTSQERIQEIQKKIPSEPDTIPVNEEGRPITNNGSEEKLSQDLRRGEIERAALGDEKILRKYLEGYERQYGNVEGPKQLEIDIRKIQDELRRKKRLGILTAIEKFQIEAYAKTLNSKFAYELLHEKTPKKKTLVGIVTGFFEKLKR